MTAHADPATERAYTYVLPFPPLLESWESKTHPAQLKLQAYRHALRELVAPALAELQPPLALWFHAAGRPDIATARGGCDLDNFLTPVVKALGGSSAFDVVAAMRGRSSETARLTVAAAASVPLASTDLTWAGVELTISPERRGWKERIAAAVGRHASAQTDLPVELDVTFRVSPQRNWMTLWKPAIDALGGILGEGDRPWHPRDDRISQLTLRRVARADAGWSVGIEFGWRELQGRSSRRDTGRRP